jgi:hypothetical protein
MKLMKKRGFTSRCDGVLTLYVNPKYPGASPQLAAYYRELLARVQALPGVQSACLTDFLPLTGPFLLWPLQIEGRPRYERGKAPLINMNRISPDYFQTMGISLRAGRPFTAQDSFEAPKVIIINETLARRFFAGEDGGLAGSAPGADRRDAGVGGCLCLDTRHGDLLFNVSATDPVIFASIALSLVGVALIASYIPARRATKVDSLQALRHE